ncbi:DUF262 domain-containing protein [Arthrobacter humicola]|uniref:DUF262 domain-containing protein n=1 Tax=Arthrobacter humicola TaxID=409291 RepID=UPI001FAD1BD4|nr:DUF262 domain-containing protein [Arthrobacter humicola]MCI9870512.1 DUF262 domain-containing protein [Arthrobacter humicola]
MKGYPTTFLALFDEPFGDRPAITKIEIPIIQRDYAQGRADEDVSALRDRFLDRVIEAATTDRHIGLDFVYGDVRAGVLQPLDGQQRLTTLFLLHWYVASRAHKLDPVAPWLRFSYSTRPTAREFTRTIASNPYPGGPTSPSAWISDQPWYVYPWRHDPTIASMLVILDAIHRRLDSRTDEIDAIWDRLAARPADVENSAIWFLFLPVVDIAHGEDLYIKMNSRGKPLTTFEVFKADFESIIKSADPDRYKHLLDSIDGAWADLLWEYEKRAASDYKIDDEFERYLTFIIEICEWRDGKSDRKWHDKQARRLWPIEERARLAFADPDNEYATRNLDFFFHAFDTWIGADPVSNMRVPSDPRAEFSKLFTAGGVGTGPVPLFSTAPDLFGGCILRYGTDFTAQETLLLLGVLLARQATGTISQDEIAKRLRSLRNITAAFLDLNRMPAYVAQTEKLIVHGDLEDSGAFRSDWVADEVLKWSFLEEHPEATDAVHQLEDHPLVRGRIMAFELDAAMLEARAEAFADLSRPELRDLLGAALLTKGDYSRDVGWEGRRRQLGNSQKDDSWTDMLTTGSRANLANIREPLGALLDDVAVRAETGTNRPSDALDAICAQWLAERESRNFYDWRYYLVRYSGARSSKGDGYYNGTYDGATGGFSYQRLRMLHGSNYNAYFSDALLRAAWVHGSLGSDAEEPRWWHRDDPGLMLKKSRIEIRSDDDAFELALSDDDETVGVKVAKALRAFDCDGHQRVLIQQTLESGRLVDSENRIHLCVRLVRALAVEGL